jgi:hypothetical protein
MGGEARARLRHSVSAASKLAATFLTLAMLAGGVALAARYGDFSMRAGDRMEMGADTLKPTTLLAMFNAPQLEGVAQEVEDTIVKIMKEAASG